MIPLVVVGAAGRMGRAVVQAAREAQGFEIRARVDRDANQPEVGGVWSVDPRAVVRAGDVVVDFSSPECSRALAQVCTERGAALVSGTTGLTREDEASLSQAAQKIAVLRSANFSLGVAALRRALEAALRSLPGGWDIEIVERHHRQKADSPSGTALALADIALAARGLERRALRHGREGRVGARPAEEIGMHAVRGGSWVGDHAVLLAGTGEWLELRHVAQDRTAFAYGALAAARFVAGAAPGLYTLDHVLGV